MRTAEKILFGVALAGLLFKIQHWPFAGVLLILSLSTLVILYSQLATRWFGDPTRQDQLIWFSRLSGIGLGIVVLGMLFTIQRWPNGEFFILIGALICAVSAVLSLVLRKDRPELSGYFRGILWRVSIFGGLGALLLYGQGLKSEPRPLDHDDGTVEVVQPSTMTVRPEWAKQISDSSATGVFVLWEPDSNIMLLSEEVRAFKGFLPASTFKVFNSLVALQEKAVADEHTTLPWDGVKLQSPDWNEDQDMSQAIARSTVWWYQEVARRARTERMQHWLDTVGYGNRTMGDSIHLFWLQGALRITPMEQARFMQRLHEEELPFDVQHQRTVKRILPGDSTATWKLQGKTGWAIRVDEEYGWYVGWVERGGRVAYFALNIDIRDMDDVRKRYTLTHALLEKEGWIDP